ncbi:hypothetical protein BDY21DRAFT_106255 [Lineolata rhizophorae]|uniref:Uncharacterized protein n=1 Tax=Lineolata rhizophorae TaxID=578093 RepID=A0A6A6NRW4_9PEZI|nr:hypothetical protein BDY21DRAFT_106255 [Lineolata rhizophorae]
MTTRINGSGGGSMATPLPNGAPAPRLNSQHPITRTLRLRQGLRRSEHGPVLPRFHLREDASACQAESFVTSRPWFMFMVETSEDGERYSRMPVKAHRLYKGSTLANVRELWKADWRDPHGEDILIGWKWWHESPSPEPEDLSGLDDLATFDLTPPRSTRSRRSARGHPLRPSASTFRLPTLEPGSSAGTLRTHCRQHQRRLSSSHHGGVDAHASSHLLNSSVAVLGSPP